MAALHVRPVPGDRSQSVQQFGLHASLQQHNVHVHLKTETTIVSCEVRLVEYSVVQWRFAPFPNA